MSGTFNCQSLASSKRTSDGKCHKASLSFSLLYFWRYSFHSWGGWGTYELGCLVHASGSYMQKHLLSTSWSVGSTPPIFKKEQANQAWNQWWIFLGNFFVIATKSPRRLVAQFLTLKMPTHQENHLGTFTTFFFFQVYDLSSKTFFNFQKDP